MDSEIGTDQLIGLNPRIRFRSIGAEGVLINMESGRVIVLNEVGLRIVQAIEKPQSRSQLVGLLTREYEVTESVAEIDLTIFLHQMDDECVLHYSCNR